MNQGNTTSRPLIWEDEAPAESRVRRMQQGAVVDPFGHMWSIETRKKNLSVPEMKRAMDAFMANFKRP